MLCCVRDRLALQILFSGPSTAACSPHGVVPPGEEVSSLSGPSRLLTDVCVKNSKNQDELALDSNNKKKATDLLLHLPGSRHFILILQILFENKTFMNKQPGPTI